MKDEVTCGETGGGKILSRQSQENPVTADKQERIPNLQIDPPARQP
jgi:hypothetical protein